MRAAFFTAAFIVVISSFATANKVDSECVERKIRHFPLHWRHPTDCKKFYKCTENNYKHEITCLNGKSYNPKGGKCSFEGGLCDVENGIESKTDSTDMKKIDACSQYRSGNHLPDPQSCRSYFICRENISQKETCSFGSYFNSKTLNCERDINLECWENKCLNRSDGSFVSNQESCLGFYICHNGQSIPQKCDKGTYYTDMTCRRDEKKSCWENFCIGISKYGVRFPDNNDCSAFYECSNQEMTVRKICEEGYFFDKDKLVCVFGECSLNETTATTTTTTTTIKPNEVICPDEKNEIFLPDKNDCYGFYVCYMGIPYKQFCDEGSYFDKEQFVCSPGTCPDSITTTESTSTEETTTEESQDTTIENSTTEQTTTDNDSTQETTTFEPITTDQTTTESSCICPGGFSEGDFIEHATNCSLFYVCYNGTLNELSCNKGNYYDPEMKICTRRRPAKCKESFNSFRSIRSVNLKEENCTCPGGYNDGDLLSHPTDCEKFFICHEKKIIEKNCGSGKSFDKNKLECVSDVMQICWTFESPDDIRSCNVASNDSYLIPHETRCDKYYECLGSSRVIQSCGVGRFFDSTKATCIVDIQGICWQPTPDYCDGQSNEPMMPHPTHCNYFYVCHKNQTILQVCPAQSWFDPIDSTCKPFVPETCMTPCKDNNGSIFLPHSDCKRFYNCANDYVHHIETCPHGMSFDRFRKICSKDAKCSNICDMEMDGKVLPSPAENDSFVICYNNSANKMKCPSGSVFDKVLLACTPPVQDESCEQYKCQNSNENYTFPTLDDPNGFCVCYGNKAVRHKCSDGDVFDRTSLVCRSNNAGCNPSVCLSVPPDTVFAALNDIHSFCRCNRDGSVAIVNCTGNRIFSSILGVCQEIDSCDPTACLTASDNTIFPAQDDDHAFCLCKDKRPLKFECPDDGIFDRALGVCKLLRKGFCDQDVCIKAAPNSIFAAFNDLTSYCVCRAGKAHIQSCSDGLIFDSKRLICKKFDPSCGSITCNDSNQNRVFAADNDSKGFCFCAGNNAIKLACPENTTFNIERNTCLGNNIINTFMPTAKDQLCDGRFYQGEFVPHPGVCNKFFICYNGQLREQLCSKGDYFDLNEKICLPIEQNNVDCIPEQPKPETCTCVGEYQEGNFAALPIDCEKFYICFGGKLIEQNCGAGNFFDSNLGYCRKDSRNKCPHKCTCPGGYPEGELIANPTELEKFYICFNCKFVEHDCGIGNYFNSIEKLCRPQTKKEDCTCPGGFRQGDLIPHPTDCDKYFICHDEKLKENSCGFGNYFDVRKKSCRLDNLGICKPECKCVGGQNQGALIPHPTACEKYYICFNGKLEEENCGMGNRFDRGTLSCIRDDRELCWVVSPPSIGNVCTATNNGAWLPHETYCDKFYICSNRKKIQQNCQPGFRFNSTISQCVADNDGTCWKMIANFCADKPSGYFMKHQRLCDHFYICHNGSVVLRQCGPGNWFNPRKLACEPDKQHECLTGIATPQIICYSSSDGRIIPDSLDITSFYICQGGKAMKKQCPLDNRFDVKREICIENVKKDSCDSTICKLKANEGSIFPSLSDPNGFCTCVNGKAEKNSCEIGSTFDRVLSLCQPIASKCMGQADGYLLPYPGDPTMFYACENNIAIRRKCQNGLQFDDTLKLCRRMQRMMIPRIGGDNPCLGLPNGYLLPGEDCNTFRICMGNMSLEQTCGYNGSFDHISGECRYDDDCQFTTSLCSQSKKKKKKRFGVMNDRSAFVECHEDDVIKQHKCPNDTKYDPDQEICSSEIKFDRPCDLLHSRLFAAAENDRKFLMCHRNQLKLFECGKQQKYDRFREVCIHEESRNLMKWATCVEDETRENTKNCSKYQKCIEGVWISQRCAQNQYYSKIHRKCITVSLDFNSNLEFLSICQYQKVPIEMIAFNDVIANGNCSKYFRCYNQKCKLESCKEDGEIFDINFQTCIKGTCETHEAAIRPCIDYDIREDQLNCAGYLLCLNRQWWRYHCYQGMYFNRKMFRCILDDGSCTNVITAKLDSDEDCNMSVPVKPSLTSCNQFYQCDHDKWILRNCPVNYIFNKSTNACIPDNESCPNVTKFCTNLKKQVDPFDCRFYEECLHGEWIRRKCLIGEYFDDITNQCVRNDIENRCSKNGLRRVCDRNESKEVKDQRRKFLYCHQDQWTEGTCLSGYIYDATERRCIPNDDIFSQICTNQPDGIQLPHPTDCTKFYVCLSDGDKIEQNCFPGGYFDEINGFCRMDVNGRCHRKSLCADRDNGTLIPNLNDRHSFFKCDATGTAVLFLCPKGTIFQEEFSNCLEYDDNDDNNNLKENICNNHSEIITNHRLIPHEIYCNIYYVCLSDRTDEILIECSPNQIFNSNRSKCEQSDWNVECPKVHLLHLPSTAGAKNACDNLLNGTAIADPTDCRKFHICSDGKLIQQNCQNGEYFDAEISNCQLGSCPIPVCIGNESHLIADPLNCNQFYFCRNGVSLLNRCYDNQFFNQTSLQCEFVGESNYCAIPKMENLTEFCTKSEKRKLIVDPHDCRRYFECSIDGEIIQQRCRNGESFDSILGFCRQNDGTCLLENGRRVGICAGKHGSRQENDEDCQSYYLCINGQKIPKKCQHDEYFDKSRKQCLKDLANLCSAESDESRNTTSICFGASDGKVFHPNANDGCRSYFECSNGETQLHRCPDGSLFNSAIEECVQDIVDCMKPAMKLERKRNIQNELAISQR